MPIPWKTNYAAAAKEAKAKNRMLMVDFYTAW
jgi:hypothetical protein